MAINGKPGYVVFIVTHPQCSRFRPNRAVHPEMGDALKSAAINGVNVHAVKMALTEKGSIDLLDEDLPVSL